MPDTAGTPQHNIQRPSGFAFRYANNVFFEPSELDLKMTFGDTEFSKHVTDQHTGIALSWQEAKIMLLFLQLNIESYESRTTTLAIPKSVLAKDVQDMLAEYPAHIPYHMALQTLKKAMAGEEKHS